MSVNENWDMTCPKCGDDSQIDITATVSVRLTADGTDADESADGSHEWEDTSPCTCAACGFAGTVADFTVSEEETEKHAPEVCAFGTPGAGYTIADHDTTAKLLAATNNAVSRLGDWLTDNTENVFEEQPDIDGIRADLHDAADAATKAQARAVFTVTGSYGAVTVCALTGDVIAYEAHGQEPAYADIIRFNVGEWRAYYPAEMPGGKTIDVCDIGFWYQRPLGFWDGGVMAYCEAERDFREELRRAHYSA